MRRTKRMLWLAPLAALVAIAAIVGRAEIGDAAPQDAPRNEAPPTISGTPEEGSTLTTTNGRWTGTEPIRYTYSWRRCDANGGSCAAIGGANRNTYELKQPDVGNTIRVRVTATNADGSVNSTSVPTASRRRILSSPVAARIFSTCGMTPSWPPRAPRPVCRRCRSS